MIPIDPNLTAPLTWEQLLPHPILYQLNVNGYAEKDPNSNLEGVMKLWPALIFAAFFFIAREVCKRYIFMYWARWMGVRGKKKQAKFGYQLWLGIAYSTSSIYGIWALSDQPYFRFPIGHKESLALWLPLPEPINDHVWFYYWWGTGFYFAEFFAIFIETRRSDFMEYVIHHLATVGLLILSCWIRNMRIGVLILLLHDVTDIFLCAAKCFHYVNKEFFVNICFVLFLTSFAFLRLWCYPSLIESVWFQTPVLRGFEFWFWISAHLLFVLQILHIYWFVLIVKMVVRLVSGVTGDNRSDDDTDTEAGNEGGSPTKKKKKLQKGANGDGNSSSRSPSKKRK